MKIPGMSKKGKDKTTEKKVVKIETHPKEEVVQGPPPKGYRYATDEEMKEEEETGDKGEVEEEVIEEEVKQEPPKENLPDMPTPDKTPEQEDVKLVSQEKPVTAQVTKAEVRDMIDGNLNRLLSLIQYERSIN